MTPADVRRRTRRTGSALFVLLCLVPVACAAPGNRTPSAGAASDASPSPPATAPGRTSGALSPTSRLRLDGIGPIRLGMTLDEAKQAAGVDLRVEKGPYCTALDGKGDLEGLSLIATDASGVARIDLISVWTGPISTDVGVRVGSTERDALAAYAGRAEVVLPDLEDHRLVVRDGDHVLVMGVVQGKVALMNVGQPALAEEACA